MTRLGEVRFALMKERRQREPSSQKVPLAGMASTLTERACRYLPRDAIFAGYRESHASPRIAALAGRR